VYLEVDVRRVDCRACGAVKREELEWLLDSPFCTRRFGHVIGATCRTQTIQDVAQEPRLDWHTVKAPDKRYMAAQLTKAGAPAPRVIGIDELSIKKRHTYRIIVSDLEKRRTPSATVALVAYASDLPVVEPAYNKEDDADDDQGV
jgi:transposase